MSIVGENLGRILAERQITRERLAREVFGHNTGSYISAIILGRKHPSDGAIARIEEYLGVDPGTLKQKLRSS